jgi:hypothetical protein
MAAICGHFLIRLMYLKLMRWYQKKRMVATLSISAISILKKKKSILWIEQA